MALKGGMTSQDPMTFRLPFAVLPMNAQKLLRQVKARVGVVVELTVHAEDAVTATDYRTEAIVATGETTKKDSSWTGSDGESNSSTQHRAHRALIAERLRRPKSGFPKRYSLAAGIPASIFEGIHAAAHHNVNFDGFDTLGLLDMAVMMDAIEDLG